MLAAIRRRPAVVAGAVRLGGTAGLRGQWLRAALITPWFAVGAGVVAAALISLHAPHQVLSFGSPAIRHCTHPHCAAPGHGSLASRGPGTPLKTAVPARRIQTARPQPAPSPVAAPRHAARDAAATRVSFQLVHRDLPGFLAFVTVRSHRQLGRWTLGFVLPGTRISAVWGADWRPAPGADGGQATGQPWPWRQAGGSAVKIAVTGTGQAGTPRDCVFDGVACRVRMLPPLPGGGHGGLPPGGPARSRPGGSGHARPGGPRWRYRYDGQAG